MALVNLLQTLLRRAELSASAEAGKRVKLALRVHKSGETVSRIRVRAIIIFVVICSETSMLNKTFDVDYWFWTMSDFSSSL